MFNSDQGVEKIENYRYALLASTPRLYTLVLCAALVVSFVHKMRVDGIFACPAEGYGAHSYLSYCNSVGYGDYDHGAFWFKLEPESGRSAAAADVLFLGSSRMQFGFSTQATEEWFSLRRISYYLLGFSHHATVVFSGPLLDRLQPEARVYIVNVDRFFHDRLSPPAQDVTLGDSVNSKYKRRRMWQPIHQSLCSRLDFLCGQERALYRNRKSGQWRLLGGSEVEKTAVVDGVTTDVERWPEYIRLAEKFVNRLPVPRECVLFTIVPYEGTKREEAQSIANAVKVNLVAPSLDNLSTFDGSHLDQSSALRWSESFFAAAGSSISRCLTPHADSVNEAEDKDA